MGAVMKMDVTSYKYFAIYISIALIALIVAIIVGAAGPQVYESQTWSAYDCPNGEHIWNPNTCNGVDLRDSTQKWEMILPSMHIYNKVWILDCKPWKWQNTTGEVTTTIKVSVTLYGSDDYNTGPAKVPVGTWHEIRLDDIHTEDLTCEDDDLDCETFLLIDEQYMNYEFYYVEISLPRSEGNSYVGDVEFKLSRYTKEFGDMELSYRTIFLALTIIALILYIARLRKTRFFDWSFEQKSVLFLLIALIFYNDPLYGFTFLAKGWFFEFLNSIYETLFISLLLLFWLVVIDKIRMDQLRLEPSILHIVQLIVIGIYAILTLSLFAWARIRASEDPVYSERGGITGLLVLFWLISAIYGGIIIWLIVLVVMTIPVVNSKKYLMNRFVFIGVPTVICIASVIVGIFTGTLGPFNRNSLGFVYFLTLYNVYVFLLVAGTWPVDDVEPLPGNAVGGESGNGQELRDVKVTGDEGAGLLAINPPRKVKGSDDAGNFQDQL